ncbi:MAG TPA: [protein-PII] uridylyltransferase [Blastocatellia bacterium]|nr:[protein-PII] uridylyltransferase [Blastocatellia bacterium]
MPINFEKSLDHANERLAFVGSDPDREAQVETFKSFLKVEAERLRMRHRFGLGGTEITRGRSSIVDVVVSRACQLSASEMSASEDTLAECAVVALGGYGRQDLAPFSDVDILFLHSGKKRPTSAKRFVETVLYLLWDMGLTVGHSFRSVAECIAMARDDLHSRTALTEPRLVTGSADLFRRLERELSEAVFDRQKERELFLDSLHGEIESRYAKFGKAVCLQEPNVKESAGGLRDLHTILWAARSVYCCRGLDALRAEDRISGAEYALARRSYDFISRLRNEAHFSTGRQTDLLTLDLQPVLAENLRYEPKRGLLASEALMRDYYQKAQDLHHLCESFLVRACQSLSERRQVAPTSKRVKARLHFRQSNLYLSLHSVPNRRAAGKAPFDIRQGRVFLQREPSDHFDDAMRLMETFGVAQRSDAELSDELRLSVRDNLRLVTRQFRRSKEAGHLFFELLRGRGRVASVLREMHQTRFLGRFLPEFARVTFLVQHDYYHKYTVDEHTLKAIEALDELALGRDEKLAPFKRVFEEIEDAAPLYLGVFLHDIGKGRGSGHVPRGVDIAERMCKRMGVSSVAASHVVFLVRHHLLMSHLAERRDITDEGLLGQFIETVGSLDRLNMLLLLTFADISAVAPQAWNDWRATLLWELYRRARSHLTRGKPVKWDGFHKLRVKEQAAERLSRLYPPSEVLKHFAMMPHRYLRAADLDQMVRHFQLVERTRGGSEVVIDWRAPEEKHCTELTVCSRDARGLVARIAGTLTAHAVNILSADLYTREDGMVIDTFKICQIDGRHPLRAELWPKVEQNLKAAIEGRYDVAAAVERFRAQVSCRRKRSGKRIFAKPSVRFDTNASAVSTVIEVHSEDTPGLVYTIARTLSQLGLNISLAKIATEKSYALDIFYVTDSEGQKLDSTLMSAIALELPEALGGQADTRKGGSMRKEEKEAV